MKIGILKTKLDAYSAKAELLPHVVSESNRSYLLDIDRSIYTKHLELLQSKASLEANKIVIDAFVSRNKKRMEAAKAVREASEANQQTQPPKKPCGGCSRGKSRDTRSG